MLLIKSLLDIRFHAITLSQIRPSVGTNIAPALHVPVGEIVLSSSDLLCRRVGTPVHTGESVHDCPAPGGIDCVVWIAASRCHVEDDEG